MDMKYITNFDGISNLDKTTVDRINHLTKNYFAKLEKIIGEKILHVDLNAIPEDSAVIEKLLDEIPDVSEEEMLMDKINDIIGLLFFVVGKQDQLEESIKDIINNNDSNELKSMSSEKDIVTNNHDTTNNSKESPTNTDEECKEGCNNIYDTGVKIIDILKSAGIPIDDKVDSLITEISKHYNEKIDEIMDETMDEDYDDLDFDDDEDDDEEDDLDDFDYFDNEEDEYDDEDDDYYSEYDGILQDILKYSYTSSENSAIILSTHDGLQIKLNEINTRLKELLERLK